MNKLSKHDGTIKPESQTHLVAYRVRPDLSVDGIAFISVGEAANKAVHRLAATLQRESR